MIDEWCAAAPERFIPIVIMPLWDVDAVRRRTASARWPRGRGRSASSKTLCRWAFRRITPTTGTGFFSACEAADIPICLHFGSSGQAPSDRTGGAVRGDDHAVRLQLDVRRRGPVVLTGLSPPPEAEGRHGRGRHRLGALSARARRLRVEPAPLLPERRPEHVAVGAVRQAHLRLLHRRRARPEVPPRHRAVAHPVGSRLPPLGLQLAQQPQARRRGVRRPSPTTRSGRWSRRTAGSCSTFPRGQ